MRRLLNGIYLLCGWLAALCILLIVLVVFGQVTLNLIGSIVNNFSDASYTLLIPSYAQLAGFLLAFSTFLSLGLGLRRAVHIRVTLIQSRLSSAANRLSLVVAPFIAVGFGGTLAWSLCQLAYRAFKWGDRATGLLALPLWIPQAVLCFGAVIFTVAAIDTFVETVRTGESEAFNVSGEFEE